MAISLGIYPIFRQTHMEMEAFNESFTMSLWRQVLFWSNHGGKSCDFDMFLPIDFPQQHCTGDLRIIRLETALNMEMVTWQTWHFRHRRFGLKVVHGRPQNLGKSSEKSPQLRRTNIRWAKAGTGTQLNAWSGLGPHFSFHRYHRYPKDPIDPRLAQQNNATGCNRIQTSFLSSIIILHPLLPFLKWLPSPLCQRAEQTSAAKLNEKERALLLDPPFHCSSIAV